MLSFLKSVLVAFFFLLLTAIVVLFGALFLFFVRTHEFFFLSRNGYFMLINVKFDFSYLLQ
jgi:hypothetical protein